MKVVRLNLLLLILIPLILTGCSEQNRDQLSIEELKSINTSYTEFFESFNNGIIQLENSDAIKPDIEAKTTPALDGYTNIEVYDIQGNAPDGKTIRDTVPYQRLMGHMDYYSYLEIIDNRGYLSSVIKIYDFNNPDPFRGILKVSKSLDEFFEQNKYDSPYYLLDATKSLLKSDNTAVELSAGVQNELSEQLKAISALQEMSGSIELDFNGEPAEYNYYINNGIGIFS